jgi:hypothetical protein
MLPAAIVIELVPSLIVLAVRAATKLIVSPFVVPIVIVSTVSAVESVIGEIADIKLTVSVVVGVAVPS